MLGSDPAFIQSYDPTAHSQPTYEQQSYAQHSYASPPQPSYIEHSPLPNMSSQFGNQGYMHRQGVAPSLPSSKPREGFFGFMSSKWAAMFMAVTAIQAVVCLCFEAFIFARFQSSVSREVANTQSLQSQYKTIPTFLALFIFGFLYELVVVWDALRMKNTIQVIGVCFANLALVVYTAIQVDQMAEGLSALDDPKFLVEGETVDIIWISLRPYLIAIPTVIALATICMTFITWRLYQEFAWDILKNIGADYRMKKCFLHYQLYIALLKFDFFFFLGFIIQLVVIVTNTSDPEFALTIVTIPITILILITAAFFTRKENKAGMAIVLVLYHGALAYFLFKLVRIYTWPEYYLAVRKSLTAFAVVTILLIILTIVNGIICMRNFGRGLKGHLISNTADQLPDAPSVHLTDINIKAAQPSRMTID